MNMKNLKFYFTLIALLALTMNTFAQSDIVWKKNFGGSGGDGYYSATVVSDGIVAAGISDGDSFGNGDWTGVAGKGEMDATVVKYDNNGNVVWKKNFGGSDYEEYYSVTTVSDGVVAVGYSSVGSFGNGDWTGTSGKGNSDAIIVKYDNDGNVVWKKNFGGSGSDEFQSVTTVADGIIAVGYSYRESFGNGDWEGIAAKGNGDAIIVKYDNNGNVVWKKNFGGSNSNYYYSVTAVSDGIIAVGESDAFGDGDWEGVIGKGDYDDAIIVKYDNNGNVVWKKNFGGSGSDRFSSVMEVSDGIIVVGNSYDESFGNGDWEGVTGKGNTDAIIVKYDNDGNVVWKKNFGGSDNDEFHSVTAVSDGIIAVGESFEESFGNGDWEGVAAKGNGDAIMVKYDNNGNVVWKKNFGGIENDWYNCVTAVSGVIVLVGASDGDSFGTGDWAEVTGKGDMDAFIVKYDNNGTAIPKLTQEASGLTIYPNPANDQLKIENGQLKIENIVILDVTGKIAATYSNTGATANIDVSQLHPGIYFVQVNGKTAKLIIKR